MGPNIKEALLEVCSFGGASRRKKNLGHRYRRQVQWQANLAISFQVSGKPIDVRCILHLVIYTPGAIR